MSLPKINPNYFAVIPASVRYDNTLPPMAKLLYGEIAALANQEGFCWASNKYFAGLYEISMRSVSELIGKLEAAGYIRIELNPTPTAGRYLFITPEVAENRVGGSRNLLGGVAEKFYHNNKTNNKKNNDTSSDEAADSHDTTDIREVYQLYLKCFKLSDEDGVTTLEQAEKRYRLTDGRRAAIRRRLKDAGKKMLMAAIVGYSREPWYKGDNDRSWTADLEKFICRSYEKVEEGANKYEAQSKAKNTNDPWNS